MTGTKRSARAEKSYNPRFAQLTLRWWRKIRRDRGAVLTCWAIGAWSAIGRWFLPGFGKTGLQLSQPIGVGKSGCAGLPSLRTVRAVFPHTALRLVVALKGLNVFRVGCPQTSETTLCEVGIRPASSATQPLRVASMTLQKLTSQTLADHPVVLVEDVPRAVTKVVEPARRHAIDLLDRRFKGLTRLSRCQTT